MSEQTMKSTVTVSCGPRGMGSNANTVGVAVIFSDSQFFPAKDGTWLMVDWMGLTETWFVSEGV